MAVAGVGLSSVLPLSVLLMGIVGWSTVAMGATTNTIIQLTVPDDLRGRVMSVYTTVFAGTTPIGSMLAGVLASLLGVAATLLLAGAVTAGGDRQRPRSGRRAAASAAVDDARRRAPPRSGEPVGMTGALAAVVRPAAVGWAASACAGTPWRWSVVLLVAIVVWVAAAARRLGAALRFEDVCFVLLGAIPGAVVGGRLVHVLDYADGYLAQPLTMLDLGHGSASLVGRSSVAP